MNQELNEEELKRLEEELRELEQDYARLQSAERQEGLSADEMEQMRQELGAVDEEDPFAVTEPAYEEPEKPDYKEPVQQPPGIPNPTPSNIPNPSGPIITPKTNTPITKPKFDEDLKREYQRLREQKEKRIAEIMNRGGKSLEERIKPIYNEKNNIIRELYENEINEIKENKNIINEIKKNKFIYKIEN